MEDPNRDLAEGSRRAFHLQQLAEKTFLRFWSLYSEKDEGKDDPGQVTLASAKVYEDSLAH